MTAEGDIDKEDSYNESLCRSAHVRMNDQGNASGRRSLLFLGLPLLILPLKIRRECDDIPSRG
jgi:hypothetical protein